MKKMEDMEKLENMDVAMMENTRGKSAVENRSITLEETLRNPSMAFQAADEHGHVVVTQDGQPRYMIINLEQEPQIEMTEDEKLEFVTRRILQEHHAAFVELAKGE